VESETILNNIVFIVALASMIKNEISSDVGVFVPKAPILHLWQEKSPEILCILSGYSALAKYHLGREIMIHERKIFIYKNTKIATLFILTISKLR
jgi:hypothetical protein